MYVTAATTPQQLQKLPEDPFTVYIRHYSSKRKKIYGGALLENIVQALARIILVRAELALAERGVYAALSVHDELIYSAKDEHAEIINLAVNRALTAPVEWLPGLALASESDIGASYGDAK